MNPKLLLWLMFFLAQLVHMFVRAGLSVGSQLTPWNSLRQYVAKFWPQLAARLFLASMLFWWWLLSPSQVGAVLLLVANPPLAGIFGWFADSFLDKVIALAFPAAKVSIPELPPEETKAASNGQ